MTAHAFYDASNDPLVIGNWWKRTSDANVGIAGGASDLCVIDCDHGHPTREAAEAWVRRVNTSGRLPRTYTVLTGRRFDPNNPTKPEYGVQLYYSGAIPGSGHFDEEGGSGDVQSIGDYVMSVGSVHPKSGATYELIIDAPVVPVPEWVRSLAPPERERDAANDVPDAVADGWKTWLLEYAARNGVEVRDYEKRVPNGWWLGIKCPWEHVSGPGVDSSTVLGVLDGKLAFECSHGTCKAAKHDTATFKVLMSLLHRLDPESEPGADPVPMLGKAVAVSEPDENGDADGLDDAIRPKYPDEVWDGTAYGEFAEMCTRDNYIPKKFFSESMRTVVGAVVGDRLRSPIDGASPRAYTVIIAPPGSGKGTSFARVSDFFCAEPG
jgi:hypothetical protein